MRFPTDIAAIRSFIRAVSKHRQVLARDTTTKPSLVVRALSPRFSSYQPISEHAPNGKNQTHQDKNDPHGSRPQQDGIAELLYISQRRCRLPCRAG